MNIFYFFENLYAIAVLIYTRKLILTFAEPALIGNKHVDGHRISSARPSI